jgi:hypothetical protein
MNTFLFYNYLPKLADHILDVKYNNRKVHHSYPKFIIENIKDNDIIFVKTDLLRFFFKNYYPKIKTHFYLITGVAGKDVDDIFIKYLNENKIIKWIGCNIVFEHPKILKIPIGFEENELAGGDQQLLKTVYYNKLNIHTKKKKMLITPIGNTHKSRNNIINTFNNKEYVDILTNRLPFDSYIKKLDEYKYVLCPRGLGTDTHRFWECLLVGSIPVVETSGLDSLYSKFPCIIVQSFKDINEAILQSYKATPEQNENINKYLFIEHFNTLIYSLTKKKSNVESVSISIGELWDKYTILLLKKEKSNKDTIHYINAELNYLDKNMKKYAYTTNEMFIALQKVNKELWDIEDHIRIKEKKQEFDNEFIQLSRSVYHTNDIRADIKKKINIFFKSSIREIKMYVDYNHKT